MNRIDVRFAELKKKKEKALLGFVSAGDPSLSTSLELLTAMCHAGLDLLELGIPFSDPTADGPVIQRASVRALKNGATLAKAIEMTGTLRKRTDIPIILFSYYNPIFAYGIESFYRDSVAAGADGMLVVDLPHEESRELMDGWRGSDEFALIRLVAPTTPPERMKKIAENASGFLYLISKTGVTGRRVLIPCAAEARDALRDGLAKLGAEVRRVPVYDTMVPERLDDGAREAAGGADIVTFTSSSTARNFFALGIQTGARFASIGPVTSATVRESGKEVGIEAREYTIDGLVEAIAEHVARVR